MVCLLSDVYSYLTTWFHPHLDLRNAVADTNDNEHYVNDDHDNDDNNCDYNNDFDYHNKYVTFKSSTSIVAYYLTLSFIATTVLTPVVHALWPFDGNTNNHYGNYNAMPFQGINYTRGYTGQPGTAIAFGGSINQTAVIPSPFVDLTNKSFTVELWFYATHLTSADTGIFGQCEKTAKDLCLIYMIRDYHLLMAFHSGKLSVLEDRSFVSSMRR